MLSSFQTNFLCFSPRIPGFQQYFQTQWLDKCGPVEWAKCARRPGVPMTSVSIEAEHNRLQTTVFPGDKWGKLRLDRVVQLLYDDAVYCDRLVNDPKLFAERNREAEVSKEKYQRSLLKRTEEKVSSRMLLQELTTRSNQSYRLRLSRLF